MDWPEKVVLITGASSGIGRGLAIELARRGAKLGLLARGVATDQAAEVKDRLAGDRHLSEPSPRLLEVVAEIKQKTQADPDKILVLPADVRDPGSVRAAADRLQQEFGKIDVLVANAGIGATADATELDPAAVANVLSVNVLGAVNSVAAVLPEMVRRGAGQLVAISSLAAYRGLRKSAAYSSSKAAVSAFFESVRIDLIGTGVEVTIIHPGFIKTPLTAGRKSNMPFLMELDPAIDKIIWAIEKRKKSYACPWQLATLVRAGMLMPNFMYDWISTRNSFRE
jgi:NAD(P)-dependent dehydrogenase (short-subunit alcohol dehydrogenase family)